MKKQISPPRQWLLLSFIALVALSPALARACHHADAYSGPIHCLKTGPSAKYFPEVGLRPGRFTASFQLRHTTQKSPEDLASFKRVFLTKNPLSPGKQWKPVFPAAVHSSQNFLVLRI